MVRIVFHSADLDGHASGAIARYYYEYVDGAAYTMHPYNYGQTLPIEEWVDDKIIFLDCSIQPEEAMLDVIKRYETIIIDHHESTRNLLFHAAGGMHEIGRAGCELAWDYFFEDRVPQFISLLGRYDVWDNGDKNKWERRILPFQHGMKMQNTNPEYDDNFYMWAEKIGQAQAHHFRDLDEWIDDVTYKGKTALKYSRWLNRSGAGALCHEVDFEGMKALVANTFIKNSQFFESKWNPEIHDCMVAWTWNGPYNEYGVSLYTTKDIDLSLVAKKFGGGGHRQAAGFGCKHIYFSDNKMIVEKDKIE